MRRRLPQLLSIYIFLPRRYMQKISPKLSWQSVYTSANFMVTGFRASHLTYKWVSAWNVPFRSRKANRTVGTILLSRTFCYMSDVVGIQFAFNNLHACFIYAVSTHKEKLELLHEKNLTMFQPISPLHVVVCFYPFHVELLSWSGDQLHPPLGWQQNSEGNVAWISKKAVSSVGSKSSIRFRDSCKFIFPSLCLPFREIERSFLLCFLHPSPLHIVISYIL